MKQRKMHIRSRIIMMGMDAILCICCFVCCFQGYALLHNTIQNNGNWTSTKTLLEKNVVGANEFLAGTQPLAHNALDLGTWFGFNEVFTNRQFLPGTLSWTFSLSHQSYIYVMFARTGEQFYAVRLSVSALYPNAIVSGMTDGAFTSVIPLDLTLTEERKHYGQIIFSDVSPRMRLVIDNRFVYGSDDVTHTYGPIGFRGSYNGTRIDDVRVVDAVGRTVFSDTFSYTDRRITRIIGLIWMALLLVLTLWRIRMPLRQRAVWVAHGMCLVTTVTYLLYALIVSDKYWKPDSLFILPWDRNFNNWSMALKNGADDSFLVIPKKTRYRILFLGTSQMWGAGAMHTDESIVDRIQQSLGDTQVECINGGASGSDSTQLLSLYAAYWRIALQPDMLVINLSNNDVDNTQFAENLRRFVTINDMNHIRTVFILEANSPEVYETPPATHQTMLTVAAEYGIPLIDLHGFLASRVSTGILWWDYVHLTSFGQSLAADYIVRQLHDLHLLPYTLPSR